MVSALFCKVLSIEMILTLDCMLIPEKFVSAMAIYLLSFEIDTSITLVDDK